jgi:GT2 family glycosyltransferase
MSLDVTTSALPAITILVPVYKNLQVTRDCFDALMRSDLPENASVTIINDGSPEEELTHYCRDLADRHGFQLLENAQNLGFVKSANIGFAQNTAADVLLLNSDTRVSGDWLHRLQACAHRESRTGTVTPFSNNGTICSYPIIGIPNVLPAQYTEGELDAYFKIANAGAAHEIPTAVGFCMYIKRACLEETGLFDEANFGHGYGEECDFSMRASAHDWQHMVAADVFVFHEGGASFTNESNPRKQKADKIMDTLHPEYDSLITGFLQADPLYEFRRNVDALRLRQRPEDCDTVLEEHFRYSQLLHKRASEHHKAMLEEQEQRQYLNQLLNECRQQFAETDGALIAAQKVVADLKIDVQDAQRYAQHLMEHIKRMEDSRSWRYTAWMRRK